MSWMKPVGDVWLSFNDGESEEATYEANTFLHPEGGFVIEWYHVDVGIVQSLRFYSMDEVHQWYLGNGFQDFSS